MKITQLFKRKRNAKKRAKLRLVGKSDVSLNSKRKKKIKQSKLSCTSGKLRYRHSLPSEHFHCYLIVGTDEHGIRHPYKGASCDVNRRVREHNTSKTGYTYKPNWRPWKIRMVISGFFSFTDAHQFEIEWKKKQYDDSSKGDTYALKLVQEYKYKLTIKIYKL